jgi:exodeoxyribonuclease V gamma subunit
MLAGRLLPARVVALLGLDDQLFPRPNPRDELDLCLARPLPGDRNPREQDRAQFLDALHAARDALLIFWNGRDARENARRPPSVVVSELLAALEPASGAQPLVVEHPLQCFSPACFTGPPEARSFHAGRARAAARLRLARRAPETLGLPGPAFLAPLPLPEPPAELRLEELARYFHNPARALLTRAGVALPHREEEPEDCEPFASDPLDRGLLRGAALAGIRAGQDLERIERGLRAAGQLPWGRAGRAELETAAAQVAPLAEEELRFRESGAAAVEVDLELAGLRLRGRLEAAGGRRLEVLARSSAGVALMGSWLRHLAWCCATGGGVTRVLCRDQSWELACPAQPARLLEVVLARWRQGQRAWLPWLPVISEQIAALADKGEGDELLERLAEHDWYERREHLFDEAWLQLALGEADPFTHPELAPRVLELALELGAPLRGATT